MHNRFLRSSYAVLQVTRVLAAYLWFRAVTWYLVGREKRPEALERVHERCAALLFDTFANLRGAYIKLGQFLSTQAILPQAYLLQFVRMQDQVTPVAFREIEDALAREWGPGWRDHLRSIDPTPLAAASIGQVHRGVLSDGREVVIKVQYPDIQRFFSKDLALVETLLPVAIAIIRTAYPAVRTGIDHRAMARELFRYINLELDYRNEVLNQQKMTAHFATWKSVAIPEIVPELCTAHVITMLYQAGARIHDWFETASQEQRDMLFETYMDFSFYSYVVVGCFQSDCHPGNFLVSPDERLILLDFGCVKEFPPRYREGTIKTVQAYINRDPRMAAEVLAELGFRTQNGTLESLQKWVEYGHAVTDLVLEHLKEGKDLVAHLNDNLAELTKQAVDINREHALASVPEEFMLLGRAFASPPIPFDKYTPQVDVMPLALEHLAEASLAMDNKRDT